MTRKASNLSAAALALAFAAPVPGRAAEQKKPDPAKITEVKAQSDAQQFCANNAASVGDARLAFQTARLTDIETQIRRRLAELEAKKVEYEAWLRKRDEVMKQATDGVVAIYAKMRPESAAQQLSVMDDPIAAAVLSKLPSRAASAILNEMETGRAARLIRGMAGSDAAPDGKKS